MSREIGKAQRVISVLIGGGLLIKGIENKSGLQGCGGAYLLYRGVSGKCPASALLRDVRKSMNINIRTTMIINRPVSEIYDFWRRLENLPLFMEHLDSVEVTSGTSSVWKAKIPGLGKFSWHAVIVNEKPNEVLGWSSVEDSSIYNAGKVVFLKLSDQRTEIDVTITYRAPLGVVGEKVARMFTPAFENLIRTDIQNFKQYMEAGFTQNVLTDFRNELI